MRNLKELWHGIHGRSKCDECKKYRNGCNIIQCSICEKESCIECIRKDYGDALAFNTTRNNPFIMTLGYVCFECYSKSKELQNLLKEQFILDANQNKVRNELITRHGKEEDELENSNNKELNEMIILQERDLETLCNIALSNLGIEPRNYFDEKDLKWKINEKKNVCHANHEGQYPCCECDFQNDSLQWDGKTKCARPNRRDDAEPCCLSYQSTSRYKLEHKGNEKNV